MTTQPLVLAALRDQLRTGLALARIWVHPADAASITLATLPAIIISPAVGLSQRWDYAAFGEGLHSWAIDILVWLTLLKPTTPFEDPAFAPHLTAALDWPERMAAALLVSLTLGGLVDHLGAGTGIGGEDYNLFTYQADYLHWTNQLYFGIHFRLPVTQTVIQAVGA